MRPLYIFDLDGTLALIDHRRPILDDESLSKDERWRKFFAACVDDVPNEPVIILANQLIKSGGWVFEMSPEIWIWSARSDEVRQETLEWFQRTCLQEPYARTVVWQAFTRLRMRQAGDFTPDVELKQRWLNEMLPEDRKRLVAVFDDRKSVVDMWRKNGVCCMQVAEGNF